MADSIEAKQAKHTPGPWRIGTSGSMGNLIEGYSGRKVYEGDDGFRPLASFQACCASTQYAEQEANAQANARLIAAAPDLLCSLREIASIGPCADPVANIALINELARAAIAKVEG